MEIHNLMEDKVLQAMNEICEEEEGSKANGYCTSEECRLDAACYVLNRVPQRYVTSGRGYAYLEADFHDNIQLSIDIVALCHEGLRRVSSIRRNFYDQGEKEDKESHAAYFNFPLIKGRVCNGLTFEPMTNIDITFRYGKELVQMMASRWPNPYSVVGNTPGTYLFWPRPIPAEKEGLEQSFEFEVAIDAPDFEPFHHFFTLVLRAEKEEHPNPLRPKRDFNLQDLFLIPKGVEDTSEGFFGEAD